MVSDPPLPSIVSAPPNPRRIFAPASPVSRSAWFEPSKFSIPLSVSPSASPPDAAPVAKLTVTPAAEDAYEAVSVPGAAVDGVGSALALDRVVFSQTGNRVVAVSPGQSVSPGSAFNFRCRFFCFPRPGPRYRWLQEGGRRRDRKPRTPFPRWCG